MDSTETLYQKARSLTDVYGQSGLLAFYDALDEGGRQRLLQEILRVDFPLMKNLYEHVALASGEKEKMEITPMPCTDAAALPQKERAALYAEGLEAIRRGELAALTMAGGQGTRLGHDGPKGTYDIGLPSHKSLFEIQCDGLKAISAEAGRTVPWYIMTSHINHDESVAFFEKNNWFGYPREDVFFFPQTMIPAMSKDGRLLLAQKDQILQSPNGNGGMFVSLLRSGGIADMRRRGIRYLFVCGIDNCLVRMADPLFMGFLLKSGKEAAAKSFIKRDAGEKAGVFCYRNGRPFVWEYTEITEEYANLKDADGVWVYGDTNVLNYIFTLDKVEAIAGQGLPYHRAVKKLTYLNEASGENAVMPDGFKFEQFLFDAFLWLEDLAVLRIIREQEFAPVKNKTGIDSAESAREMYLAAHPACTAEVPRQKS